MDGWICLIIGSRFFPREKHTVVEASLRGIFGADLIDHYIAAASADVIDAFNYPDFYAFVRVSDYSIHVGKLKRSHVIIGVLPSYDHPQPLSDDEVLAFQNDINEKQCDNLRYGDVVTVREGYLSDLTGIVVARSKSGLFRVYFRLHSREFL